MAQRTPAETLASALSGVRTRVRFARVVAWAPATMTFAAGAFGILGIVRWVAHDPRFGEPIGWLGAGLALALGAPLAFRVSLASAARLADASHGLDSRLENAVVLGGAESLGAFERAAVEDGLRHLPVDARRAAPIEVPRHLPGAALALAGAVALLFVPLALPPRRSVTRPHPRLASVELDRETVAAMRAELAPLRRETSAPDVERRLQELDALLDQLATGGIDRDEAFRRLDAMGRAVAQDRATSRSAEEALGTLARALGPRSAELDPLRDALREADPRAATEAMRALSSRMNSGAIDRAEIERIRQAFARMTAEQQTRQTHERELERRRDALRVPPDGSSEPSVLERRQRELERLERELGEIGDQRRELERLERELDEAAEDLERSDPSSAARDLDEAAEDLNRMAREQTSAEQRRQLARQIEQLREALRRQSSDAGGEEGESSGSERAGSAMQRFVLRAGGEGLRIVGPGTSSDEGAQQSATGAARAEAGEGGNPQSGAGPTSDGQAGASGQPGQPGQPGAAGPGAGTGQNGEATLRIGPDGRGGNATLELPGEGRGPGAGAGPGGGGRDGTGRETSTQTGQAGVEHIPTTLDSPTDLDSRGEVSRVDGADGRGATRSQVIRGASSSGFAGRSYRDVHADYANHAEEVLEREDVPSGYRYYVHRYFQLIRPREGSTP